ncbi:hypothetical protein [Croceitalea vernalis]|uniref:DUF4375 domain-containing protein n=1 Tax=Croceitalea vernalis TaxID=3075599 RepID=A0ABU3BIQ1_9FLAO|nr:hypothetical protein [Croceitalea sp. P007]MDT0622031.1 hypothetical protein [Croceitalea sp. P007]
MRKIILVISLILICISCQDNTECNYIESYYQEVYLAEEAYYEEDYQKVFDKMSEATLNCKLLNQPMIYEMMKYAESAARIGENEKTFELIRELILNGYEINQLTDNDGFKNVIETAEWKKIENEYENLHSEYLNSINLDLREEIGEMERADQLYRVRGEYNDQKIDSIDAINEEKLKKIVKDFGYPDDRIIGGYKIDNQHVNAGILLFHFDDYEYWTRELKELIKTGQAPPRSLGTFVDSYKRRVPEEKKYIYGIYDNARENEIVEFEKLDARRTSIGLPPMALKKRVDELRRAYYAQ